MSNYQQAPARRRSQWPMIAFGVALVLVIAACVVALVIHAQRNAGGTAMPSCATVFKLGAPIVAGDATIACTNRLGLVSRSHSMPCTDGRPLIFDRDSNVYGFAGGKFAISDVAADGRYAQDFSACVSSASAGTGGQPDNLATHPLAWGASYHGRNLDITVSAPVAFTPTASAFSGGVTGKDVAVTITVANHGTAVVNPLGTIVVQATAGQTQATEVVDDNIGEPTAGILPGKALTWRHGFVVPPAAGDLTVGVGLLGGQSVYFTGTL